MQYSFSDARCKCHDRIMQHLCFLLSVCLPQIILINYLNNSSFSIFLYLCLIFLASQSANCGSYNVGQVFKPTNQPCVTCQCLANRFYADPNNYGATCSTLQCPELNCSAPISRDGQCCPVCPDARKCSGIRITNCPSSSLSIALPASSSKVIYEFDPTYEDCLQLSRNVRVTREPLNNLFEVGTYSLKIGVNAGTDSDQCQFTLYVRGQLNH